MIQVSRGAVAFMIIGTLVLGSQTIRAESTTDASAQHVMVNPGDLTWTEGPASLPVGAQMAVIEGNPKEEGLFTMRLKLPANYRIQAHWHPTDEHVTVISGTLFMGMGDKLDTAKGKKLPAGSFALMPKKSTHYAWTTDGAVIQLHGIGPWGIHYVNPVDDPRT